MTRQALNPFILRILMSMLLIAPAFADRLLLESGDVLTGTYIGKEEGRLVFESNLMGRIHVDPSHAELVVESSTSTVSPLGWLSVRTPAAEDGESATSTEAPRTDPPGFINFALRDWGQEIRIGYTWESATSRSDDFALRYSAKRQWDSGSLLFQGRYEYGSFKKDEEPKQVVRDRWQAGSRLRSDFIDDRFFLQVDAHFKRDEIKRIAREIRQKTGIGWRIFRSEKLQADILPQVTFRYLKLMDSEPGWETLLSLTQSLRYQLNERVAFLQAAGVTWSPDAWRRSGYDFQANLENKLTEALFINLGYELEFEYQLDMGIDRRTQRTILLLGWKY